MRDLNPVCSDCYKEMRCIKNGVQITIGVNAAYYADEFGCDCGNSVITNAVFDSYREPTPNTVRVEEQ